MAVTEVLHRAPAKTSYEVASSIETPLPSLTTEQEKTRNLLSSIAFIKLCIKNADSVVPLATNRVGRRERRARVVDHVRSLLAEKEKQTTISDEQGRSLADSSVREVRASVYQDRLGAVTSQFAPIEEEISRRVARWKDTIKLDTKSRRATWKFRQQYGDFVPVLRELTELPTTLFDNGKKSHIPWEESEGKLTPDQKKAAEIAYKAYLLKKFTKAITVSQQTSDNDQSSFGSKDALLKEVKVLASETGGTADTQGILEELDVNFDRHKTIVTQVLEDERTELQRNLIYAQATTWDKKDIDSVVRKEVRSVQKKLGKEALTLFENQEEILDHMRRGDLRVVTTVISNITLEAAAILFGKIAASHETLNIEKFLLNDAVKMGVSVATLLFLYDLVFRGRLRKENQALVERKGISTVYLQKQVNEVARSVDRERLKESIEQRAGLFKALGLKKEQLFEKIDLINEDRFQTLASNFGYLLQQGGLEALVWMTALHSNNIRDFFINSTAVSLLFIGSKIKGIQVVRTDALKTGYEKFTKLINDKSLHDPDSEELLPPGISIIDINQKPHRQSVSSPCPIEKSPSQAVMPTAIPVFSSKFFVPETI